MLLDIADCESRGVAESVECAAFRGKIDSDLLEATQRADDARSHQTLGEEGAASTLSIPASTSRPSRLVIALVQA